MHMTNIGDQIDIPSIFYQKDNLASTDRVNMVVNTFNYLADDAPANSVILVSSGFNFRVGRINVIYGPSGAGKSSIINQIKQIIGGRFIDVVEKQNDYLIEMVGEDAKEAIRILTHSGLGEGNLFLRTYSQLSEGQKFRMQLALELDKNSEENLFIDEFASKLDPSTAKAVARTFSKQMRKKNQCLFVCCNNPDVAKAFGADVEIAVGYDNQVEIQYPNKLQANIFNTPEIELLVSTPDKYEQFRKYHYLHIDGRMDNAKTVLAISEDIPVGIIIMIPPLSSRREILHPYFKLINSKMISMHRIVVHPEFRGTGIAKKLAVEAPDFLGYEIIETRSTLFDIVPVPLSWGYKGVINNYYDYRPAYYQLESYIKSLDIEPNKLLFKDVCLTVLQRADKSKLSILIKRDEDERHKGQLLFYCSVMEKCGYPYTHELDELTDILVSIDRLPVTDEDFVNALMKHNVTRNGSYYMKIK
ncbi:hypothetical protein [Paenibacillus periandrae]|uniref:hypothetical protein n=1 Tax=Paenibacillus periandrae TaxID=1761741 RepID=UPI001F095682|nr:hypothetical protein [Paenibacillus periandrae]